MTKSKFGPLNPDYMSRITEIINICQLWSKSAPL
ncbi:Uncharacterised protein [Yersinia enterocolitica]|uniref:Uncharacterized protein n=1 Tax=Yersinia enterocolitica TaxID=630 RepID=A0A0H5K2J0_YEREN|nr:hypothetical protein IOK_17576 [Yersinia enterocolitica subsp. palearctica PhRBD_Ye1]CFQ23063.1 Uncharacterised protein [Yersinia enterocolitica]VEA97745.1 Uncharacterised protein [Yersinia enterocolitica subsp. enterocolitica]VEF82377.1 Uncharacterised protein [Yersinia enterocolitica subsp. palearctica]CFQ61001.1 Uncharacterised protein [Yersinia enterocolitica]